VKAVVGAVVKVEVEASGVRLPGEGWDGGGVATGEFMSSISLIMNAKGLTRARVVVQVPAIQAAIL
jgi:hypothetical protein